MYENPESNAHDYQNNDLPAKETFEALEQKIADLEAKAISVALHHESQLTYYKNKYFTEASKISDVKDYLDEMWDDNTDEDVAEEYETIANKLGIDIKVERTYTIEATFTVTVKGSRGDVSDLDASDFSVSVERSSYRSDWSIESYEDSIDSCEES